MVAIVLKMGKGYMVVGIEDEKIAVNLGMDMIRQSVSVPEEWNSNEKIGRAVLDLIDPPAPDEGIRQ